MNQNSDTSSVQYEISDPAVMAIMPLVSVLMITYNHGPYLAEAIEGVIAQKADFPMELIIGEDCSTDNTREIALEYQRRYPHLIQVIYSDRNVGMYENFHRVLEACRGEFIALCEGDDYWTDPYKLQKQVDLLETHPEYPICFHPVYWLEEKTGDMFKTYYGAPDIKSYYTLDELLEYSNFIPTVSAVFRNFILKYFPEWYYKCLIGDYPLHVLNLFASGNEKIGFVNDFMAVYRRHGGGVHGGKKPSDNLERLIQTYNEIGKNLGLNQRSSWNRGMTRWHVELYRCYIKQGEWKLAFLAAKKSITFSPKLALKQLSATTLPQASRLARLVRKSAITIRHQGFSASLNKAVHRLGLTGYVLSQQRLKLEAQINSRIVECLSRARLYVNTQGTDQTDIYRYAKRIDSTVVYASVYAALLHHLMGDIDRYSDEKRHAWCTYINSFQCEDGLYRDVLLQNDIAEVEDWWGWRHLSAHVVTALTALGAKPKYPFAFLNFLYEPGYAAKWIVALPWREKPDFVSNTVMNYGVLLQYERDFQGNTSAGHALEEIFGFLDRIQDPETGLWGKFPIHTSQELSTAVQTAYHLWNLYFYDGRPIQYQEHAIDSCLATQNRLGGYGVSLNSSACEDIDSIDPLCRFYFMSDYRRDDIRGSLEKALPWILVNQMKDGGFVFRRFEGFAYGHDLMTTGPEESHLFATWFRTLSLAYICEALNLPGPSSGAWRWIRCPGYQFWNIAPEVQSAIRNA